MPTKKKSISATNSTAATKRAASTTGVAKTKAAKPVSAPSAAAVTKQVLDTWRIHNELNLNLLAAIPAKGLGARPAGSRGRTVAEQFEHMARVRLRWLVYIETGGDPKEVTPRSSNLTRPHLRRLLKSSGQAVERLLSTRLAAGERIREFRGNPVRWMGYLIAHESHHRGSILLALKQEQVRLSDQAKYGLWTRWFSGA